jgi:hypothetical protein
MICVAACMQKNRDVSRGPRFIYRDGSIYAYFRLYDIRVKNRLCSNDL